MSEIKFGPRIKGAVIMGDVQALIGKRALVCFDEDKKIIGRLGRNSFSNNTLCLTTGNGNEDLYGKFFFEPGSARYFTEIL